MGKSTDVSKGNAGNSKGKSQGQGKGKVSVVSVTQVSQPDGTEWHRMEAVVEFTVLTCDVSRVSGPAKHFSEARALRPPRVLAWPMRFRRPLPSRTTAPARSSFTTYRLPT